MDGRALLLRATVGFAHVPPGEPELQLLHRWLDNWRGVRDVVTGMKRQGYEVSIGDHGSHWIAIFYQGHGGYETLNVAGSAQAPADHGEVLDAGVVDRARGRYRGRLGCVRFAAPWPPISAERFGWIGFEVHPASASRVAGYVLMVAGIVLISRV